MMCWQYQEVDVAWLPIWLPVICAGDAAAGDRRAAQRDGERQATDAGRAAARLAVLYFAQFEVLAVVGGGDIGIDACSAARWCANSSKAVGRRGHAACYIGCS